MTFGRLSTPAGHSITLGAELGKGGEGAVYEVVGSPDLVAKLYIDGRAEDRRAKIEAMVAAGLHRQAPHISFPIDMLLDERGIFVGFTMRRVGSARPIHQLWNAQDRQKYFPEASISFMVRVAANAARTVAELHHTGCVIGDINESGFLVTDQATVVLIDSDSIQFAARGKVFPCVVGTPEYLPPEHQGINQRKLGPRDPNHDNFGLAVLIFRLLMIGTHPFGGVWKGSGDPTRPERIKDFRYAYGADSARMKVAPQPTAPPVAWLPDDIRRAFDHTFGASGVRQRPTASDWIDMLDRLEADLVQCQRSRFHHHLRGSRSCPWCETERKRKQELFGPPKPSFQQKPFSQSSNPNSTTSSNHAPPPKAAPQITPLPSKTAKPNTNASRWSPAVGMASTIVGFLLQIARLASVPVLFISFFLIPSIICMMIRNQLQQAMESPDVGLAIIVYAILGLVFHVLSIPAIIYFSILQVASPSLVQAGFLLSDNSGIAPHLFFWLAICAALGSSWYLKK